MIVEIFTRYIRDSSNIWFVLNLSFRVKQKMVKCMVKFYSEIVLLIYV